MDKIACHRRLWANYYPGTYLQVVLDTGKQTFVASGWHVVTGTGRQTFIKWCSRSKFLSIWLVWWHNHSPVFQESKTFKLQDNPSLHIDRVTCKSSVRSFNSCTFSSWDGETLRKCSWLTRDLLNHVALLDTCAATLTRCLCSVELCHIGHWNIQANSEVLIIALKAFFCFAFPEIIFKLKGELWITLYEQNMDQK